MDIFVDLETDGLIQNGVAPNIICVSVVSEKGAACYKWNEQTRLKLKYLAEDNKFIYHNSSFDNAILEYYGVEVPEFEDTMIMSYAWQPNNPNHSLGYWGNVLKFPKMPKPWVGLSPTHYTEELDSYCINDGRLTQKLYYHLKELLESDPEAYNFYLTIEMPFAVVIQEMERTGMYVDKDTMQVMLTKLQSRAAELKHDLVEQAGLVPVETKVYKKEHPDKKEPEWRLISGEGDKWEYQRYGEFNPASNIHKAIVLRNLCGWEPTEFTPTGEPSVGKDVLNLIDHPIADTLLEYGTVQKITSSFLLPFERFMDSSNILRGNFNQTVTITGRLSSSNPNMQNLPARGELGKELRNIITVPNESVALFNGDLSNIEARMLAWMLYAFLGVDTLAKVFMEGRDFHTANAEAWGVARDVAKTLLFAILYGASAMRIAKTLKKSQREAQMLIDKLNAAMPEIQAMKEFVWETAREQGGVMHTLMGHRLVYPDINSKHKGKRSKAERQLFNAFIQGSSGDVLKYLTLQSMPIIHEHSAALAASVHDELLGYAPTAEVEELCSKLTKLFSTCDLIAPVPISADFHFGTQWGAVKAS